MEEHNTYRLNFHERTDFDFKDVELTTCIIIDEALKRGIEVQFILSKYLQLGYKGKKALFYISDNNSLAHLAEKIMASKYESKEFLKLNEISVPKTKRFKVTQIKEMKEYITEINEPFVVKPEYGSQGKHVYCNVSKDNLEDIINKIKQKHNNIVIEEKVFGNEYRILATTEGFIGAVMRRPASVLGDGKHTIEELIKEKNKDRQLKNSKPMITPFYKIHIDDVVISNLERQGFSLDYVPGKNDRIYLRENSNISTGGDSIAVQKVHPRIKEIIFKVLDSIPGMSYAGIDVITRDITKNPKEYYILELNNMPGLSLFHYPYIGEPQNAAGALIDLVLPESRGC